MVEHPEYYPARADDFGLVVTPVPGQLVHVEGWARGAQFKYLKTIDGVHLLRTPTYNRVYRTRNRLLWVRNTEEARRG